MDTIHAYDSLSGWLSFSATIRSKKDKVVFKDITNTEALSPIIIRGMVS